MFLQRQREAVVLKRPRLCPNYGIMTGQENVSHSPCLQAPASNLKRNIAFLEPRSVQDATATLFDVQYCWLDGESKWFRGK